MIKFNIPECRPVDSVHAEGVLTCEMSPADMRASTSSSVSSSAAAAGAVVGQWVVNEILPVALGLVSRCIPTVMTQLHSRLHSTAVNNIVKVTD